jgi:hypothetical protein
MRTKFMVALLSLSTVAGAQEAQQVTTPGNPIIDTMSTTDPAPLVDGDNFYIIAGRDEAPPGVNDFIMNEWQLLSTNDPASGRWTHRPNMARPEKIFAWAEPGRAYAAQIVKGPDGRFYLYAPILQRTSDAEDRFSIGVAVAETPTGPFRDAHPAGPIVSQKLPVANKIHNIDPTVLVASDGRVWMYWGSFGQLRGIELKRDMVTTIGKPFVVSGLTGYFEAPWIMERKGTYYMVYAGNNAGPTSDCTPAVYYACQAYGTAPDPKGPWTYRGVILKPVSSTTSHAGIVPFHDKWYMAYHTADGKDGGHFHRSVAVDEVKWDDSVSPPRIMPIVATHRPEPPKPLTRNIAGAAIATASNAPIPLQYWIGALNDGKIPGNPLPPDMWGSWTDRNPPRQWIEYRWSNPVTLNGSTLWFWADQPAGSGVGVAPPAHWRLEYWDRGWKPVAASGAYGTAVDLPQTVAFAPVTTRCLRAVFDASGAKGSFAGVAVKEWQALSPKPQAVTPPSNTPPSCGK